MNIEVKLLHNTPLSVAVTAIRQCYDSGDKSDSFFPDVSPFPFFQLGKKDEKLLKAIVKDGHTSTLEHLTMNFQINGISRLVLQELARHRMASLSVKSTRYTLKELKKESESAFIPDACLYNWDHASKYINLTGIKTIDRASIHALERLRFLVSSGEFSNDEVKYALPECYKVDLVWSINLRSIINFLELRLSPRAHFEIRELSKLIYQAIPNSYKFLIYINQ